MMVLYVFAPLGFAIQQDLLIISRSLYAMPYKCCMSVLVAWRNLVYALEKTAYVRPFA
jgi:hypothetical protein